MMIFLACLLGEKSLSLCFSSLKVYEEFNDFTVCWGFLSPTNLGVICNAVKVRAGWMIADNGAVFFPQSYIQFFITFQWVFPFANIIH